MQHDSPTPLPPPPRRQSRLWLTVPLVSLTMALLVALAYRVALVGRVQLTAKPLQHQLPLPPVDGGVLAAAGEGETGPTLLSDSILSIIQSYYVDPGRVDNRGLLDTALAALATSEHVHTGSAPGQVWVQIDEQARQSFSLSDEPTYPEVMSIVASIGQLLDKAHVSLTTGEVVDKNASGVMMLLNSMLAELDAHSSLLSPDAYRELRQGTEGSFGGLGVLVGLRNNLLTVIKPLPRSPAQRAGIKKFDHILGIGGVFTYGFSLDDLVEYMRGEPGSEVQLTMLRDGAQAPVEMKLKREVIHVDSVTAKEIDKNGLKVLHLTIESFANRTSREVLSAIKKYKAKTGGILNGLVLDLRSNPGGLLDQAVQVADLFLDSGVIVTTKGRRDEVEKAGSGFDEVGYPVAVLIDGESASASEIVAGALQDQQRAVVIGQPSFGKGSVQTVFELPGDRALKLTIARYYTPAGRSIQNVGIIPDVWLQPVAKSDDNEHMFGPYRYKNERFLKNHLITEGKAAAQAGPYAAVRRSYYLAAAEGSTAVAPDREMDAALRIIQKVHQVHGDVLPPGTRRASHWLGLAGPQLAESAQVLDKETVAWLRTKHHVEWRPLTNPLEPKLELQLNPKNPRDIVPGDTVALAYTLINHDVVPMAHASIFVRSEAPGFDTKEVLLGEIPAASRKSGTVQVTIPTQFEPGLLPLRVGVALDAWPVPGAAADFNLNVNERPVAQLWALAELTDETGGRVAGVLEAGEAARIRVDLRNDGAVDAGDLEVKLVNLAGNQVQIVQDEATLDHLAPGEIRHVYLQIKAGRSLVSSELAFGVFIQSPDLKAPFRQRFVIQSQPQAVLSGQPAKSLSH